MKGAAVSGKPGPSSTAASEASEERRAVRATGDRGGFQALRYGIATDSNPTDASKPNDSTD